MKMVDGVGKRVAAYGLSSALAVGAMLGVDAATPTPVNTVRNCPPMDKTPRPNRPITGELTLASRQFNNLGATAVGYITGRCAQAGPDEYVDIHTGRYGIVDMHLRRKVNGEGKDGNLSTTYTMDVKTVEAPDGSISAVGVTDVHVRALSRAANMTETMYDMHAAGSGENWIVSVDTENSSSRANTGASLGDEQAASIVATTSGVINDAKAGVTFVPSN